MRVTKCHIDAFGKIKDKTFDFTDGLNQIIGDNGWGKTTLTVFIKSMLYGLNGTGKRSVDENERMKYRPWGSTEQFGGYMEFINNGKPFRIMRYFGTKDSEDTVVLTDLTTGKTHGRTEIEWGNRLFGVDEEGFFSTAYFCQKDFEVKSNHSITVKYNSVVGEEGEDDSFKKTLEKLEDKYKAYKQRGDKGLIPDTKREIWNIGQEINKIDNAFEALQNVKEENEALERQRDRLIAEENKLAEEWQTASAAGAYYDKKQRHLKLVAEIENVKKIKRDALDKIGKDMPSSGETEAAKDLAKDYITVSARNDGRKAGLKETAATPPRAADFNGLFTVLAVVFAALLIVGAAVTLLSLTAGIIIIAAGVICLATLIAVRIKKRVKPKDVSTGVSTETRDKIAEDDAFLKQAEITLSAFIKRFGGDGENKDYLSEIEKIKEGANAVISAENQLKSLEKQIEELSFTADARYENQGGNPLSVADIKAKLDRAKEDYRNMANKVADGKARIIRYEDYLDGKFALENRKREAEERLKNYEKEYDILGKTLTYLKKAEENLKIKYKAPIENGFRKYLSLFTADGSVIPDEKNIGVDMDMRVAVTEKGGVREKAFYSEGYKTLFEICKRLALIEALYAKELPFIIMDDPFTELDDVKTKRAMEIIGKMAEEYQIIYFTCSKERLLNNGK